MDTGVIIYAITMGWAVIILGGLTFLITRKKETSLISGFSNRPKEEQEYLETNGFIDALGKVLFYSFIIFTLTYIFGFFPIPFVLEVGMTLFMLVLFIGLFYIQRYEYPTKRQKSYWTVGSISIITFVFLLIIGSIGFLENSISIEKSTLIIDGMYGEEILLTDIEHVEKKEQLPEVIMKTNGFAMGGQLKGNFKMTGYENTVKLLVSGDVSPYIVVKTGQEIIIFNRSTSREAEQLYKELSEN